MSPVYERKDRYYKKAKEEGSASRAIYKLEEIDKQFHLLQPGQRVLEFGCAPGGWLQYVAKRIGPAGKAVGVDLLPVKISLPLQAFVIQGDATQSQIQQECIKNLGGEADVVLSDISPNLSGIRFRDNYLSYELAKMVLEVSKKILKFQGVFLVKIFPGEEFAQYKKELQTLFREVKILIPQATRKGSSEVYVVGKGFRPPISSLRLIPGH